MDSGLPLADECLGDTSNTDYTSSHNPRRFSTCEATSIPKSGPYGPTTYLLYDSHICPHIVLPTKAPLPRGAHIANMASCKNTCTTSTPQITNSEECFYVAFLPHTCP